MGAVRKEYERFLAWLGNQTTSDDTRRIANLVLGQLDELLPLGTQKSARSKRIVELAEGEFESLPTALPRYQQRQHKSMTQWQRLRRLDVGPFRGFARPESFDLDRPVVLIYGPNGAGKSSLCEALEFALLGRVIEADCRRIDLPRYLENVWCERFEPPRLIATDANDHEISVVADEELFRFCFVEKNRIESFARLSAATPAERTRRLADLFGVDAFDEFVRGFNETLGTSILTQGQGPQRLRYESARAAVKEHETVLQDEPTRREELQRKADEIASSFQQGASLDEVTANLGTTDMPGRLQELQRQLEQPLRPRIGLSRHTLTKELRAVRSTQSEYVEAEGRLESRREDISFKKLFEAVRDLETASTDRCPACDTPIAGPNAAKSNPFEKAKDGLRRLAELASLEQQRDARKEQVSDASECLLSTLQKIRDFASRNSSSDQTTPDFLKHLPKDPQNDWWAFLLDGPHPVWGQAITAARHVERHDADIDSEEARRETLRVERERLQGIRDNIVGHQAVVKKWQEDVADARAKIEQFNEENRELLFSIAEEDRRIALHGRINAAYDSLLPLLRQYRDELPGALAAGLNEKALCLYNLFNRNDAESDKLADLSLPLAAGDRLDVAFAGRPLARLDALQVLSEGHLRCLGLAILLAKNITLGCPLVLFDDAVNAIDPDHREGIRLTLFKEQDFSSKQIIVTCHGEEFMKDIQNSLGASHAAEACRMYVLLPHEGDCGILVDRAPVSRNYLLSAEEKLNRREVRGALADARRGFEALNHEVWRYLAKHNFGELKLRLDGPRARYEHRNLADCLLKRLRELQKSPPQVRPCIPSVHTELVDGYSSLLEERSYRLLNIGTHESADEEDPDANRARLIIDTMKKMDSFLHDR